MHVQRALLQQFTDFVDGEPAPGDVSQNIKRFAQQTFLHEIRRQTEQAAQRRGEELESPFVLVFGIFRQQDLARDEPRPGDFARPTSDCAGNRTGARANR